MHSYSTIQRLSWTDWRLWLWIGVVAAAYSGAAKVGLMLAFVHSNATAVWPPTGIAIAALLLLGWRASLGIFVGAFLVNFTTTVGIAVSGAIAAGNTLEALTAMWLINRFAGGVRVFDRAADIARYVLAAAPVAVTVSATIGALSLALGEPTNWEILHRIWLVWWLGDLSGALIIAPLLILWFSRALPQLTLADAIEGGLLLAAAYGIGVVVFGGVMPALFDQYALGFLVIPPMAWSAFRFGRRGAITIAAVISVQAIIGTWRGHGPFAGADPGISLLVVQAFSAVVTVTSLIIATLAMESSRAQERQRQSHEAMDLALSAGRMGAWEWNVASGEVTWTAALEAIHGLPRGAVRGTIDDFQRDIHPQDREKVLNAIQKSLKGEDQYQIEYRILRPNGSQGWLQARGRVVRDEAGHPLRMAGVGMDITERKQAEKRLAAEHTVTRVLAEAATLQDAAPEIIRAFCVALDGTVGELWVPDETGQALRCDAIWTTDDSHGLEPFLKISREIRFPRGVGLPGRVWAGETSATIADLLQDPNFPRREAARQSGLRSGHAFPIAAGGQFLGVIEFFSTYRCEADEALLAMMAAIGQDIAQFMQRQRAERESREGQERYRTIVESSLDAVISIDTTGRVIDWNSAAEKTFGYSRAQAVGVMLAELIVPSRLRDQHRRGLARFLETGTPGVIGRRVEMPAVCADGKEIQVELAITVVETQHGMIFTAHVRDITDRLRSEQAQRLLATIVTFSDDAIISNAPDGTIITWNRGAERMLGYTAEEVIGRHRDILLPPERQREEEHMMRRLLAGEHVEPYETVRIAKDGRLVDVSLTMSAIRNSAGVIIGASKIARDITLRKKLEQELQQHRQHLEKLVVQRTEALEASQQHLRISERMAALGTLSTGIGHDMGNLLLPLRSRLDVLRALDLPPEAGEHVNAIELCVQHLYGLVRGLRLMALDPEQQDSDSRTNLVQWRQETIPFLSSLVHNKIGICADIPDGLPDVAIAPHVLTQAVRNLIKNSRDAIGADRSGGIVVQARANSDGAFVRLAVIDTGAGMPPQIRARALEPFFTTRKRSLSTGMGLSTVHGMVHAAGGRLEIHSPPPADLTTADPLHSGKGTAVVLVLPVAAPLPQASEQASLPVATVSVADSRLQTMLGSVLRSMGVTVHVNQNGSPETGTIWITDECEDRHDAVRRFLSENPANTAVVIGGAPELWRDVPVKIVDRACQPSAIRTALGFA